MSIIDLKDLEKEKRRNERKQEFERKVREVGQWVSNNKDVLLITLPVAGVVLKNGTKLVKGIHRSSILRQEKNMKERMIFDRSLGKYLELKRPLKNADMKAILARRDNGEKLSSILLDMNLLK